MRSQTPARWQNAMSALNYYFSTVPHTFVTRADLFLNYIDYDTVQSKIFDFLFEENETDPMSKIRNDSNYHDTYNFLRSLQDRLPHLAQY